MKHLLATLGVLLAFCCDAPAQSDAPTQKRFAQELAHNLLGSDSEFTSLGDGLGERGFLLAQLGSTVGPISEAYSGLQGDFTQSLADIVVFDKPVEAVNGVAVLRGDNLSDVWRQILDDSRPGFSLGKDRVLDERTMKWLFARNPGQSDPTKRYSREPSDYYKRYQQFERNYSLLLAARQGEVWRALPGFEQYKTFENAEAGLIKEWFKSGYKAEIESAMWRFSSYVPFVDWQAWAQINAQFEGNMVPYGQYMDLPITRLFPPPASWSTVSMWYRGTSHDASSKGEYRFQYARVRISRPWMNLEALLSGKIKVGQSGHEAILVSDGRRAAPDRLPSGTLGAYIEELILVRNITHSGEQSDQLNGHPLGNYAYPDAINILGYVVRTLPAIP